MKALYVSDLDGTLLTNAATLSDYSRSALRTLLAEGLKFSVASARSVASMRTILRGLTLELPVIGSNEEDSVVKYIRDHRAQSAIGCGGIHGRME